MLSIQQILTFAYDCEYESAYDLPLKRNFSNPKIYSAKGNQNKRWYVYFSFRDPNTAKLKRLTPFYGHANPYKTKEERMEVLLVYRKVLLKLLKRGYNPFQDNTELHNKLNTKKAPTKSEVKSKVGDLKESPASETPKMTIKEAFDFGLKLKEKWLANEPIRIIKTRLIPR